MLRLLFAAALAVTSFFAHAQNLPPPVAAAIKKAAIDPDNVAVWVQALNADTPTTSVNAQRPLNPASVMKLVTAFTALEHLGPGFTWSTRVAHDGALENERLSGNL